jgi:hypothetical protein
VTFHQIDQPLPLSTQTEETLCKMQFRRVLKLDYQRLWQQPIYSDEQRNFYERCGFSRHRHPRELVPHFGHQPFYKSFRPQKLITLQRKRISAL